MFQGKAGWWVAGACAVLILISIGYGMGRRASPPIPGPSASLTLAGAPLPPLQIEPIQPQEELAAISSTPVARALGPALADPGPAPLVATAAASNPSAPTIEESARVREIQRALKSAGFDPGQPDGRLGPRTKMAIRDFQLANGLEPDGKVGPRTWSKLETYLKETEQ